MGNQQQPFAKTSKRFPKSLSAAKKKRYLQSYSTSDLTLPPIPEQDNASCIDLGQDFILVDDQPRKLIHKFNDLKRQIYACSHSNSEEDQLMDLMQKLDAYICEVTFCPIAELRTSLREKCERLRGQLKENLRVLEAKDDETLTLETHHYNVTKKALDVFVGVSLQLEAIRARMLDYYGGGDDVEYAHIEASLQECLDAVLAVRDRVDLRIIVTREEYEDYIEQMRGRFGMIVLENRNRLCQDREVISSLDSRRKMSQVNRVKKATTIVEDPQNFVKQTKN